MTQFLTSLISGGAEVIFVKNFDFPALASFGLVDKLCEMISAFKSS